MAKQKQHRSQSRPILLSVLGLTGFGAVLAFLLRRTEARMFNPKGQIAAEELRLMFIAAGALFLVAIPTLAVLYYFSWKYRESNPDLAYDPATRRGKKFELFIWVLPTIVFVVLSVIMWTGTHRLEPRRPLASGTSPMRIEVVALRWKWLFIYPEQKIATVNYVQFPVNTPIEFDLTADETPMSSFWIPNLSGMLYAMTGDVNRLNLVADTPGEYPGSTAEINGAGFAGMRFVAKATTREAFDDWARQVRQTKEPLDAVKYQELLVPSTYDPVALYAKPSPDLYATVIQKYMNARGGSE